MKSIRGHPTATCDPIPPLGAMATSIENPRKPPLDENILKQRWTAIDLGCVKSPVDRQRVLLTGYSKGGIGTWELAARHPDRFTAAIVMAGRPRPEMSSVDWRVPLYVIHAREDEVLDLGATEEIVTALRDRGVPVELHILEGVTHYETQHFARALHRALPWLERTWGRP